MRLSGSGSRVVAPFSWNASVCLCGWLVGLGTGMDANRLTKAAVAVGNRPPLLYIGAWLALGARKSIRDFAFEATLHPACRLEGGAIINWVVWKVRIAAHFNLKRRAAALTGVNGQLVESGECCCPECDVASCFRNELTNTQDLPLDRMSVHQSIG